MICFIRLLNKWHIYSFSLVKTCSQSIGLCDSRPGCESPVWTGTPEVCRDDLQQFSLESALVIQISTITAKHPKCFFFNPRDSIYLVQVICFKVFYSISIYLLFLCEFLKKMFCGFFPKFNVRRKCIWAVILSVMDRNLCKHLHKDEK